jgi:hypothetical protein
MLRVGRVSVATRRFSAGIDLLRATEKTRSANICEILVEIADRNCFVGMSERLNRELQSSYLS